MTDTGAGSSWRYLVAVAVLGTTAAWLNFRFGLRGAGFFTDEAWMTVVTRRLLAGEVLYRDVFSGATPLSLYAQAAVAAVFGAELAGVRLILHFLFVATLVVTAAIGEELRLPRRLGAMALAGAAVWTRPAPSSTGSAWALLFLMVAMYFSLRTVRSFEQKATIPGEAGGDTMPLTGARIRPYALLAGLSAGLAFASKQDVGVLTVIAMLVAIAGSVPGSNWHALISAFAGFGLAVAAFLLPVFTSGAGSWLLSQGFGGQDDYLGQDGIPYADYVRLTPQGILYLLPLALLAVGMIWWRSSDALEWRALHILLFALAGLLSAFPRADPGHLSIAAPCLALATVFVISRVRAGGKVLYAVAALAVLAATAVFGRLAAVGLRADQVVTLPVPGLRGISMSRDEATIFLNEVLFLSQGSATGEMLLVHPHAPRYYLASGLRNPTRYDLPVAPAFGRTGQEEVVELVRNGAIELVCLNTAPWAQQPPQKLIAFIREEMWAGPMGIPCQLYSTDPQAVNRYAVRDEEASHRRLTIATVNRN